MDGISTSRRHRIQSIIVIPPPPPSPHDQYLTSSAPPQQRKRRRKTNDDGTHPAAGCKEEDFLRPQPVINIPDDLLTEILSRLPAKHLLRFKSVCRPWLSIISQPTFVNTHLRRNINHPRVFLLPFFNYERHEISCDYDSDTDDRDDHFHEATIFTHTAPNTTTGGHELGRGRKKELPLYFAPSGRTRNLQIMGSCHGFICICVNRRRLVLFNPSTRVHLKLPPCRHSGHEYRRCFFAGIGYDSSTCHYKVLRATVRGFHHDGRTPFSNIPSISRNSYCNVEVHILTLNNNSSSSSYRWRKIRGIDNVYYVQRHSCVYSNSSLHWLISKKIDANDDYHSQGPRLSRYRNSILSFDLADETFREMAVPEDVFSCSLSRNGEPDERERLGCLGDCLAFSYCFPVGNRKGASSSGVIWIMKEYNRKKPSWTQLTTFPLENLCPHPTRILPSAVIPLCFLEEEKKESHVALLIQDMFHGGTELVSLSLIDHSLKELDVLQNVSAAAAIYVDTLVSSPREIL